MAGDNPNDDPRGMDLRQPRQRCFFEMSWRAYSLIERITED